MDLNKRKKFHSGIFEGEQRKQNSVTQYAEDNIDLGDRFLDKREAHQVFKKYGYSQSLSHFTKTKWKELTKRPLGYDNVTGRYTSYRVLKSECLNRIKEDIKYMKREAQKNR